MDGIISVRRAQFDMAHKVPTMSIWWGKQYLEQREPAKPGEEGGQAAAGGPVAIIVDDLPQEVEEAQETAVWSTAQEESNEQGE